MQTISTGRRLVNEALASAEKWEGNFSAAEKLLREAAVVERSSVLVLICLATGTNPSSRSAKI